MLSVFGFNSVASYFAVAKVLLASSVGGPRFPQYFVSISLHRLYKLSGSYGRCQRRRCRCQAYSFQFRCIGLASANILLAPSAKDVPGVHRTSVKFRCIVFVPVVRVLWRCQRRCCDVRPISF